MSELNNKQEKNEVGIFQRPGEKGWRARIMYKGVLTERYCDTKAQAKQVRIKLKEEARANELLPVKKKAESWTVRAAFKKRVDNMDPQKPYTRTFKHYAEMWCVNYGDREVPSMTNEDIEDFMAWMRTQTFLQNKHQKSKPKKYTESTIRKYVMALSAICTRAVQSGKAEKNPVSLIEFEEELKSAKAYTAEQVKALQCVMQFLDWIAVGIAVLTGLRQAEQFGARWDQINFEQGLWFVPHAKKNKQRYVVLEDQVMTLLKALPSYKVWKSQPTWERAPFLFPSVDEPENHEKHMDVKAYLKRAFLPALVAAKIKHSLKPLKGVNWHSLRHTYATLYLEAHHGEGLAFVMKQLGHSSFKTTQRYEHIAEQARRKHLKKQGGVFEHIEQHTAERLLEAV